MRRRAWRAGSATVTFTCSRETASPTSLRASRLGDVPFGEGVASTVDAGAHDRGVAIGYDNVAVEAATQRGIWVARVPDYCLEDVSDQALALLGAVHLFDSYGRLSGADLIPL